MKIIYSGKRAAPPRADMFLPKWLLVFSIILFLCALALVVFSFLMTKWSLLIVAAGGALVGVAALLCWKNQTIKLLDEDTFRYTTFLGNSKVCAFSRVKQIRVNMDSLTLYTNKGNVHIEASARVTRPLADKLNELLARQGKKYRVGKVQGWRYVVIVIAAILGFGVGYFSVEGVLNYDTEPVDKRFTHEGISITLTDEFLNTTKLLGSDHGYDVIYGTDEVSVMVMQEPFALWEGAEAYTVEEYAQLCIEANGFLTTVNTDEAGLVYFEYDYTNAEEELDFHYYAYTYKSADAFWLIQFAVLADEVETYAPQVARWAASAEFEAGEYVAPPNSDIEGDII